MASLAGATATMRTILPNIGASKFGATGGFGFLENSGKRSFMYRVSFEGQTHGVLHRQQKCLPLSTTGSGRSLSSSAAARTNGFGSGSFYLCSGKRSLVIQSRSLPIQNNRVWNRVNLWFSGSRQQQQQQFRRFSAPPPSSSKPPSSARKNEAAAASEAKAAADGTTGQATSSAGRDASFSERLKLMWQRFLAPKEMPPRHTAAWYREVALICTVFGITGSSTMVLVRPAVRDVLGIKGSFKDGPWSYRICSIVIMSPIYAALLVVVGTVFGRHAYFRHFSVKIFSRFGIPPELLDKNFHETKKHFRKW